MGISSIPVAKNYITTPLSQLGHPQTGTASKSVNTLKNGYSTKIQKITYASDITDYTKKDALQGEWNKRGRFKLDLTNGKIIYADESRKYWNPHPSEKDLRELEQELQESGLQKEVDWVGLKFDLKEIGFHTSQSGLNIEGGALTRKTEYLASRYAAVEEQIKNTVEGSAQAEQLKKLDEVYQEALEKLAGSYSEMVGTFLEMNGVSGETGKIYDSIANSVGSKIEAYRKALPSNAALEGLKGTRDAWLLGDNTYVASILRASVSVSEEAARSKSEDVPYTLDDLETLGQYVSALARMEAPANEVTRTFCMDESRLGVEYAMLDMKTDKLCNSGRVSGTMSDLLQKTMNGFMRSYLERLDQELSKNRAKGGARDDTKGYASLDRRAVWDVYQHTMREYRSSGDVIRALLSGVEYGTQKTAVLLETGGTYRAKDSAWFWSNFFKQNQKRYESRDSSYQKYLAGWRDFENSLIGGGTVRMNLDLKGSEYYAAGKSRLVNKTV